MTLIDIALITQFTLLAAGIASFIEDRHMRHRRREKLSLGKHLLIGSLLGLVWSFANQFLVYALDAEYISAVLSILTGLLNGFMAGFLSRSSLAIISRRK